MKNERKEKVYYVGFYDGRAYTKKALGENMKGSVAMLYTCKLDALKTSPFKIKRVKLVEV